MKTEFPNADAVIRRYRPEDVPPLFAAVEESREILGRWMPWCHPAYSIEDSSSFVLSREVEWQKGEHYSFVIADRRTGSFIGGTGLNFVNRVHNFANIGYWIRSSHAGRGFATCAVRLVARFGFEELGFHRLEIVVAVENKASVRVAEKAGARYEGSLRNRLRVHGNPHDALLFSFVPADFKADALV